MPQAGTNLGRDSQSRVCQAKERPSPDGTAACVDSLLVLSNLDVALWFSTNIDSFCLLNFSQGIIGFEFVTVVGASWHVFRTLSMVHVAWYKSRGLAFFCSSWTLSSQAVSVVSQSELLSRSDSLGLSTDHSQSRLLVALLPNRWMLIDR